MTFPRVLVLSGQRKWLPARTMKRAPSAPVMKRATTAPAVVSKTTGDTADTEAPLPFRTPSFRDLQRECAYLKGRLADAVGLNGSLQRELEILRARSREEAAYTGKLNQEVAASEESARATEAQLSRETTRSREAQLDLASTRQAASQMQERLKEAAAREERLLLELKDSRDGVSAARAEVAELRAVNASLGTELRATQSDLDEVLAQMGRAEPARRGVSWQRSGRRCVPPRPISMSHSRMRAPRARSTPTTWAPPGGAAPSHRATGPHPRRTCAGGSGRRAGRGGGTRRGRTHGIALHEQHSALREERAALRHKLAAKEEEKRAARSETYAMGAEAHALTVRMGLYRAVLKSESRRSSARAKPSTASSSPRLSAVDDLSWRALPANHMCSRCGVVAEPLAWSVQGGRHHGDEAM